MDKILRVHTVNDYARYIGAPELHPLVSVIHYDELEHCRHSLNNYDVYALFIGDEELEELSYGQIHYTLNQHALMCVAPGQIGGKTDTGEEIHTKGWALLFDTELLRNSELGRRISAHIRRFIMQRSQTLLLQGFTISETAEVTKVDGKKIEFKVAAYSSDTILGEGTHLRFIVDKEDLHHSRLPVKRFLKDVAVGHWAVGLGESVGLVLDAEHRQVLATRVLQRTLAIGSHTDDGALADGEDLAVHLILALALQDDVKLLVGLVSMEKTAVLTRNERLE